MKIRAVVEIEADIENIETFEQANECLYDMLFDGLCRIAPCNFWIQEAEEVD